MLGITRKTLFYYDHIELVLPVERVGTQSAKVYDEEAVERLRKILAYKQAGLTLREIRKILDEGTDILPQAIARMKEEIHILEREILTLEALLSSHRSEDVI